MKSILMSLCFLTTNTISFTQEISFIIPAGSNSHEVIPAKHIYQYPDFISGKVFFRDGTVVQAKMNYNRLTDEMLFISPEKDTLAIDNEPTLNLITINKDSFVFDEGYIMLQGSRESIRFGVKHGFKFTGKRKIGAYDVESPASSISSFSSIFDGRSMRELKVNEKTVLATHTSYYFGDRFNQFVLANRKNLIALFPGCADGIKKYCRKNKIDFGKGDSLTGLISFVNSSCQ
jgi:hypothetical protein